MRACFYIGPGCSSWSLHFFPGKSPGELPVAGKSWCRHMVDQCSSLKVTDIYIADCYYKDELPARMGQGDYWSLHLHYHPVVPCQNPELLLKQIPNIPESDDLLIFWGQVMPDVSDIGQILAEMREVKTVPKLLPDGIWLLRNGTLYECKVPLFRMRTLKEYFDLNFRMLEKPGIYNLPGYSNSEGCVFGMDVMIMPECELEKPVLIQDYVRLDRRVTLRGQVIVGRDVLINEGSSLEHSIVLDHTYIGKHMDFRNMIIDENRVIDVSTETMVELEDKFLAGSALQPEIDRYMAAEFVIALILILVCLPLYLIGLLFRKPLENLPFFSFLLQVYPKCWQVLRCRAHLVRYGQRDANYAFRYSDQWLGSQDENRKIMGDVYFYYNRSVIRILRTVILSLLKRVFVLSPLQREQNENSAEEGQ